MYSRYIARLNIIHWVLFSLLLVEGFFIQHAFARSETKRGITIEDLSTIQDIRTMVLSPNGKYIAFQTMQADKDANRHTLGWYVVTTKLGAKVKKVAEGNEIEPDRDALAPSGYLASSEIIWSPDSQWIYFTKRHRGKVQIWRSHREKSGAEQLTHNQGDVQSLRSSEKGSKILFTIGRTRAEIKRLIKEGAKRGYLKQEPPLYTIENGPIIPPCTDGRGRIQSLDLANNRSCILTVWVYEVKSGIERIAKEAEKKKFYDQPDSFGDMVRQGLRQDELKQMQKMSPDGTRLAWIENEDPETYKGYYPPMILRVSSSGEGISCLFKVCKRPKMIGFRGVWWHPNGKEVIFQVRDGRLGTLTSFYGWTPDNNNLRRILSSDDRFSQCNISGKRLICGQETWTSPKKIVSVNLDNGAISAIVDVNPAFQNLSFTKIEKIFGEDDYGHGVYAHLVYPKGYKKGHRYPLVITQYTSGGFLRGAVGDEQPIHVYVQNGIAVLSLAIRHLDYGILGRTTDPMKVNVALYMNFLIKQGPATAIENMVEALANRGIVDTKRVGISGLSTGASITDSALIRKNYAAASTAYSNLASRVFFSPSSNVEKVRNVVYGGGALSPKGSEARKKYTIDLNAKKIDTPYLIQVADREIFQTILNYNALKEAGKPVEMIIYPDEYHVKWQPAHKYMVYQRNLDWFNFWLRGVEDPDPEKAGQYQRWRKLRELHLTNLKEKEKRGK